MNEAWKHLERWQFEEDLYKCVQRLLEILETKELSNNGREFHPVYISSCRVMSTHELSFLLSRMKELALKEQQQEEMREWNL